MTPVRILLVDDSLAIRVAMTQRLCQIPGIYAVGVADPYEARDRLEKESFDVMVLDLELPRMGGLTFLKYLMKYQPMPVVILSSHILGHPELEAQAHRLGAFALVAKPHGGHGADGVIQDLVEKVRAAVEEPKSLSPFKAGSSTPALADKLVLGIGASTGGPQALESVLRELPEQFPPVLCVIHMPARFTAAFAQRLDKVCALAVREAVDRDHLLPGTAYLAPGDWHLSLDGSGRIRLDQTERLHSQRPSVDILFDSLAHQNKRRVAAALLTGMGRDGAQGLLNIRKAGGFTLAQDEASSVVWGMPKEAIELGAACQVLPLGRMANELCTWAAKSRDRQDYLGY